MAFRVKSSNMNSQCCVYEGVALFLMKCSACVKLYFKMILRTFQLYKIVNLSEGSGRPFNFQFNSILLYRRSQWTLAQGTFHKEQV